MTASVEVPRPVQHAYLLWVAIALLIVLRLAIAAVFVPAFDLDGIASGLHLAMAVTIGLGAIWLRAGKNWARNLLAGVGGAYAIIDVNASVGLVTYFLTTDAREFGETRVSPLPIILGYGLVIVLIALIITAITLMFRQEADPYFSSAAAADEQDDMTASAEVPRPVQFAYLLWVAIALLIVLRTAIAAATELSVIELRAISSVLHLAMAITIGLGAFRLRAGTPWARSLLAGVGGAYAIIDVNASGGLVTYLLAAEPREIAVIRDSPLPIILAFAIVVMLIALIITAITLMYRQEADPYFSAPSPAAERA